MVLDRDVEARVRDLGREQRPFFEEPRPHPRVLRLLREREGGRHRHGVGLDEQVPEVRLRHDDLQELVPEAGPPDRERATVLVGLDGPVVDLRGRGDVRVVEVEVGQPAGEDDAVDGLEQAAELVVRDVEADGHGAAAGGLDPFDVGRGDVRPFFLLFFFVSAG